MEMSKGEAFDVMMLVLGVLKLCSGNLIKMGMSPNMAFQTSSHIGEVTVRVCAQLCDMVEKMEAEEKG